MLILGIVGGHAYSILEVKELHNVCRSEQKALTDFFTANSSDGIIGARSLGAQHIHFSNSGTLRLIRMRNPWGRQEWQGDLSSIWTEKLKALLEMGVKGDGTFWIRKWA